DMFGAFTALFAGLAFAGAVITIYLQVTDSADARREHEETVRRDAEQIKLLQEQLKLQLTRHRVEAGPFFALLTNAVGGNKLNLVLINSGAPVIVQDFECATPGCSLAPWRPSILPSGAEFHAPTNVGANPTVVTYRMRVRDRWGDSRVFKIRLDFTQFGG